MFFDYLDKEKMKFYFKNGDKMIGYKNLFSCLIYMKDNNLKEEVFIKEKSNEEYTLKIRNKLGDNKFEFKIDDSPILYVYGKKKVFFEDKDGNVKHQIYVYNKEQLFKFQMYLILKNKKKNVEFFDVSNNLIIDTDSDKLFDMVHYLKINEDNGSKEQKQNEDYYKNIFDNYIGNIYSNNGEKLSFNIDRYANIDKSRFEYINTNSRTELFDSLQNFINSQEHYIAFTGVSGTGKTITLLNFLNVMSQNYPSCYFNIKTLTKTCNIKILASEFVKLFTKDLYDDYIKLIHQLEDNNNFSTWNKIIEILDFIIDLNIIKGNIIIIIDQYKIAYDDKLKLLEILQSYKYKRIKFIICSSIHENDIKSSITYESALKKLKLKSILIYKFINHLFSVENIIKNDKIKEMMELFCFIPKYYYLFVNKYHPDDKKVENEDNLKQEINQFLSDQFDDLTDKFNSFFLENNIDIIKEYNNICKIFQGETLNEIDLIFTIQKIPLKYSIYENIDNLKFKIQPAFDFIYGPLRKVYKNATIPNLINTVKIMEYKNRGEFGNIFDSLVNYHFDLGKNIFGLKISHVIIVNEIVNFSSIIKIISQEKDYFIDKINLNNLFDKKVIYLEQHNSNGQCVDGGFLIPISNSDSYALLLYQSSIRKRKHFSKDFIYNYIYKTTKNNINEQLGIKIEKIYFMYIIDRDDKSTIKFCNDSDIYFIFYDYDKSKFFYGNQKEINEFNENIYDKMEIYEPNLEMMELFKNQEAATDLTLFKKFYLGKKRKIDNKDEENKTNKKYNIKDLDEIMIKTKKGYKNSKAALIKGNSNDYEQNINKIKPSQEEKIQAKDIPKKWKSIFKDYNSYQIITKNTQACNAIFCLPIFYIYDDKYLIIKNEANQNKKYSFYDFNTGKILEKEELQKAIDLLNIFSDKSEKPPLLDAYFAQKILEEKIK